MEEITDSQLILLDNLIYLNGVTDLNGRTVADILRYLLEENGLKDSEKKDKSTVKVTYPALRMEENINRN